jgi:coiled-coil domain-containing protein 12
MSSRKSRLKELRDLSEKEEVLGGITALKEESNATHDVINPIPAANDETNNTIKLRNYVPKDISALTTKSSVVEILTNAVAPEFKRKKEEEDGNNPDDVMNSNGTKKQNWDLKRDVSRKTEKLERRTIRAIAELAREEEEKRES